LSYAFKTICLIFEFIVYFKLNFSSFNSDGFSSRLLNENSYVPREAGSQKDESLAFFIENQFRAFLLSKIWRDEHFVKIQVKSSSAQNSVTIVGTDSGVVYLVESPEGYVAYSKAATVTVSKAKQCMRFFPLLKSSETPYRYFS